MFKKLVMGILVGCMLLQSISFDASAESIAVEEEVKMLSGATVIPNDETGIPDEGLYTALLEAMEYPEEGVLTVSMLESIPSLVVGGWQVESLEGIEYCKYLEELYIYDYLGTDIDALGSLKYLQKLLIGGRNLQDISGLSGLTNITELDLSGGQITNISALAGMTGMSVLNLSGNQIEDVSALFGMTELEDLSLSGNQITDISALSKMSKVTNLNLSENQIEDISALSGMTALEIIYLGYNKISNVNGLAELSGVTHLELTSNELTDIAPLVKLTSLDNLYLGENKITDISALSGMEKMQLLELQYNQISNIDALSGLTDMAGISIMGNRISDISALVGMTGLQSLNMGENQIANIDALAGLKNLSHLIMSDNLIEDISVLQELTALTDLAAANNKIKNLDALAQLHSLAGVVLSGNEISDVSPLASMGGIVNLLLDSNLIVDPGPLNELAGQVDEVDLSDNQITDISGIADLIESAYVMLDGNPIVETDSTPEPEETPMFTPEPDSTPIPTAEPEVTLAPTATPTPDEDILAELFRRLDTEIGKKSAATYISFDVQDMELYEDTDDWEAVYDAFSQGIFKDRQKYFFISAVSPYYNTSTGQITDIQVDISSLFREKTYTNWSKIDYWNAAMEYEISQALSVLSEEMTDAEKILALYNYVILNCAYDYSENEAYAYSALVEGDAVCEGYTKALMMLLEAVGMEVRYVTSDELNHSWVLVQLEDGYWYHIDPTWDDYRGSAETETGDPVYGTENDGFITYSFFLQSDEEFRGGHSGWNEGVPAATKSGTFAGYSFKELGQCLSYCDGMWYYLNSGATESFIVKTAFDGSNQQNIPVSDKAYYMYGYGDKLYYSTIDKIYCYDTKTQIASLYYDVNENYSGYVISELGMKHQKSLLLTLYNRVTGKYKEIYLPLESGEVEGMFLSTEITKLTALGATRQLEVSFVPAYANPLPDIVWSSENPEVASVDSNGLVTAVAAGTTTITAKSLGGSFEKKCQVTVQLPVAVTGVNITGDKHVLAKIGDTLFLEWQIVPNDAEDWVVSWESSNPSVATVDEWGTVTAVSEGTAIITIITQDGGFSDSCEVTVKIDAEDTTTPPPTAGPAPTTEPADPLEAGVKAFVERMYTVALGRESDTEGVNYWTDQLLAQTNDGATVARGFLLSEELTARGYSDSEYVKVLYETFFNRAADADGEAYWCSVMDNGTTRAQVLAGFVNSNEFFELCAGFGISKGVLRGDGSAVNPGIYRFAERLYSTILERNGDKDGIEYWTLQIDSKACSPEDAAINFFWSGEYLSKNSSDEEYVCTLYSTFMDRVADESGLSYWRSVLDSGTDRQTVLRGFAHSNEFKSIMAEYGL